MVRLRIKWQILGEGLVVPEQSDSLEDASSVVNRFDELLNRDMRHLVILAKPTTLVARDYAVVKNSLHQSVLFEGERATVIWLLELKLDPFVHELFQHGAALHEGLEIGAGRRERAQREAHERKQLL